MRKAEKEEREFVDNNENNNPCSFIHVFLLYHVVHLILIFGPIWYFAPFVQNRDSTPTDGARSIHACTRSNKICQIRFSERVAMYRMWSVTRHQGKMPFNSSKLVTWKSYLPTWIIQMYNRKGSCYEEDNLAMTIVAGEEKMTHDTEYTADSWSCI